MLFLPQTEAGAAAPRARPMPPIALRPTNAHKSHSFPAMPRMTSHDLFDPFDPSA
ncbi:hypothetical protein LTR28_013469, partial [Elasticomyces elasticus]